jgi:hypothetical protein
MAVQHAENGRTRAGGALMKYGLMAWTTWP